MSSSEEEEWAPRGASVGLPAPPAQQPMLASSDEDEEEWARPLPVANAVGNPASARPVLAICAEPAQGQRLAIATDPTAAPQRVSRQDQAARARAAKAAKSVAARIERQRNLQQQPQQESSATPPDGASRLALALTSCHQSRYHSFLKPAMAIAEECGVGPNHFGEQLWGLSGALLSSTEKRLHALVRHLCAQPRGDDASQASELVVYCRVRKYDETVSVLSCTWDHGPELLGPGQHLVDSEVGPTKVFVSEVGHGMLMQKTLADGSRRLLGLAGRAPFEASGRRVQFCRVLCGSARASGPAALG